MLPQFYYYLISSLFAGFLISISIIWPSYLYSEHSIRGAVQGGAAFSYATGWSFSIREMITFIIPSFYGFGGNSYWGTIEPAMTDFPNYLGIFTIIFIIYGLLKRLKNNTYIYFLILSVFFLLLSLGKNFFLFEFLFNYLPFFNKFRVPMMALMIFQFSIIIVASLGLQSFANILNNNKKLGLKYLIIITGSLLSLFIIFKFFIIRLMIINDNLKNMIQYDLNILIIILITILGISVYLLYNTIKKNIILASIIFLTTINMYVINNKILKRPDLIIESTSIENILDPLERLKEKYKDNKEKFRFISFTKYNGMRNWAGYANLENVNGYHPAKLKNYGQFEPYIQALMQGQVTYIGINVLKLLNVQKIINWNGDWEILSTKESLNSLNRIFFVDELKNYKTEEELLIALNSKKFDAKKVSYTKSNIPKFEKSNSYSKATIKSWSPNRIIIETDLESDNFIALSEIYYPNWEIKNHNIEIIQINGLLRGFLAPKGKNSIIMEFNYNDVKYASLISFITFIVMLLFSLSTFLLTLKNKKN